MSTGDVESYVEWKGWTAERFMAADAYRHALYDAEAGNIDIAGQKVLEIGFGGGTFLRWAKDRGADIYGCEIVPELVEIARARGDVHLVDSDLSHIPATLDESFRLIAAFDVLEHLTLEETRRLLAQIERLLQPGGFFLARFPNGESPFGRVYQYRDATHRTVLSGRLIGQLLVGSRLKVVRAGDARVPLFGSPLRKAGQWLKRAVRNRMSAFIKQLYDFDGAMGTNMVVLVQRS